MSTVELPQSAKTSGAAFGRLSSFTGSTAHGGAEQRSDSIGLRFGKRWGCREDAIDVFRKHRGGMLTPGRYRERVIRAAVPMESVEAVAGVDCRHEGALTFVKTLSVSERPCGGSSPAEGLARSRLPIPNPSL